MGKHEIGLHVQALEHKCKLVLQLQYDGTVTAWVSDPSTTEHSLTEPYRQEV